MAAPSMVSRNGDTLVVRSVVSGDALFGTSDEAADREESSHGEESDGSGGENHELPQCKIKRNYTCSSCDYYTQNPRFYLYHQKQVHKQKIKIFECPQCLYASKHSQKLQRHVHMVHVMGKRAPKKIKKVAKIREKPVRPPKEEDEDEFEGVVGGCGDQEPIFSTDGTQVYKCSVCDMTSKTQALVARHERVVHLKKKIFRCTKCNYMTHMKARYTKHVKYHSMPMIKCDMCDFKTPYKWNLDRHNKNHQYDGAFKCVMCNFSADIKQSLTVHEMNHHVPPVGHIAGVRRRLRVGASDTMGLITEEDGIDQDELDLLKMEREGILEQQNPGDFLQTQLDENCPSSIVPQSAVRLTMKQVLVPVGQKVNEKRTGLIQIQKYRCKVCDFQGNLGEVHRHEMATHGFSGVSVLKKSARPIPNLIPIQGQSVSVLKPLQERKSTEDMTHLNNSSLKDFAKIIDDDNKPEAKRNNSISPTPENGKTPEIFIKKNASFFDKLKERLMTSQTERNLTCPFCNFESKCLAEHIKHRKTHIGDEDENGVTSQGELSSTRCQHCRHRCKTSNDLVVHLRTCPAALSGAEVPAVKPEPEEEEEEEGQEEEEDSEEHPPPEEEVGDGEHHQEEEGHPMENKVFVWNTIGTSCRDGIAAPFELNFYQRNEERIAVEYAKKQYAKQKLPAVIHQYEVPPPREIVKKVFKCPNCPFWASTASRFHVHIVGHLNKRPFQCSLCHYSSNWRWDITKHIRLKQMRDSAHERARVLLTDEAGRRNYSKYNKYLSAISPEELKKAVGPKKLAAREMGSGGEGGCKKRRSEEDPQDDEGEEEGVPRKKANTENKKTMWKCKKCLFRDGDRSVVLAHVKDHYRNPNALVPKENKENLPERSNKEQSPPGSPKDAQDEEDEDSECPDFMCETCPFVCTSLDELDQHSEKHFVAQGRNARCQFCPYYAENSQQLLEHLDLHTSSDGEEPEGKSEVYACFRCPYVASNHLQLVYHRQWHRKSLAHKCMKCSYSAHNNIILSLHVRLHGKSFTDTEQVAGSKKGCSSGGVIAADMSGVDTSAYPEIPMVWVSKPMGISKMFKCRYCPHVNMRKTNIVEHEKMHCSRDRESSSPSQTTTQQQHHCPDCNYICNNAGVLSSHMKVHQAFFGQVCGIVDNNKPDEEQIEEMKIKVSEYEAILKREKDADKDKEEKEDAEDGREGSGNESDSQQDEKAVHFCPECPARFLRTKEVIIHMRFHNLKLPFKCDSCSYTARQKQHLLAHLKVHTDEYQERTSVLFDTYPTDSMYQRPKIAVVLSEPGDPSSNVSKEASVWVVVQEEKQMNESRDEIVMPDKNGTPRKTLNCDKCPAEFYKALALEYHRSLHNGKGPHKCKYCDYAVKTYGNLLRHEAVHVNHESQTTLALKSGAVPTSGTELFKQKTEAQKTLSPLKTPPLQKDPEFGSLIFGNPDFYYPTYLKNGRLREKRYKCHKCPSAFEKREQYKVHLSLHGSKQRYNCERCDYSVKYFANYSQHMKKHSMNDSMKKEQESDKKKGEDENYDDEREMEENVSSYSSPNERCAKSMKISVADQQAMMLMQLRNVSNNLNRDVSNEVLNRCPYCPYTNKGKEGVSRHVKCHSENTNTGRYKCKYCDYNVPKLHFLREHLKLHFTPSKLYKPDAFMKCDHMEIWSEPKDPDNTRGKELIFKDKGFAKKDRFLPPMEPRDDDFENMKGRVYINLKTGEEEVELDEDDEEEEKKMTIDEDVKEEVDDKVKLPEENGHDEPMEEEMETNKEELGDTVVEKMEVEVVERTGEEAKEEAPPAPEKGKESDGVEKLVTSDAEESSDSSSSSSLDSSSTSSTSSSSSSSSSHHSTLN